MSRRVGPRGVRARAEQRSVPGPCFACPGRPPRHGARGPRRGSRAAASDPTAEQPRGDGVRTGRGQRDIHCLEIFGCDEHCADGEPHGHGHCSILSSATTSTCTAILRRRRRTSQRADEPGDRGRDRRDPDEFGRFTDSSRAWSSVEPVSDAPHSAHQDRVGRVRLDLLAQAPDVNRDGRRVAGEAPDVFEELFTRESTSGWRIR